MSSPFATRTTRLLLTLFVAGGMLWLGGNVVRSVVGFDVYYPGTLQFRAEQTEAIRLNTIRLFAFTGAWTNWGFVAATVGALGLMGTLRAQYRSRGWLLMAAILMAILIPAQGYLILKDYELLQYFDLQTGVPLAQPAEIIRVFSLRVTNLANSMTAGLSLMAGITIAIILVTRPLHRQ
ncbi:MAG: hypothetical protein FGM24_00030 [Candidatus Kapabacteria bacterium]|nr:hypothetical protein [Candidatus Kapabacteria bacterium]